MPLPFPLTGLDINTASDFTWMCGPFKPTKGTYYFTCVSAAQPRFVNIYEAIDPTDSWTLASAHGTGLTSIGAVATVLQGNTLFLVVKSLSSSGGSTQEGTAYAKLNLSNNTNFVSMVQLGAPSTTGAPTLKGGLGLGIRSDGIGCMTFNGALVTLMGADYSHVYYRTWNSTGTNVPGTDVRVSNSAAVGSYVAGNLVVGANNDVHIMFKGATGTFLRTLNSSNVLQTQQTMAGTAYDLFSSTAIASGGSTYVATSGDALVSYTSASNPTAYTINTNNTLSNIYSYLNTLYSLDYSVSTSSIRLSTSTNFGVTWSTPTQIQSLTSPFTGETALSRYGQIYQRGSQLVLPYIYRDGSTYFYNEYVLSGSRYTIIS